MKIAVDATFHLYGGSATHLRRLLAEWRDDPDHEFDVITAPRNLQTLSDLSAGSVRVRALDEIPDARLGRLRWFHLRMPRVIAASGADVLFCGGGYLPYARVDTPSVVLFRNAGPFCDSSTLARLGLRQAAAFRLLGHFMRRSAACATRILVPSTYLRNIAVDRLHAEPDRVVVVCHGRDDAPESCDPDSVRQVGIPGRFVLYVSHLYRYKNVLELLDAWAIARDAMRAQALKLVIAGGFPDASYRAKVMARKSALALDDEVVLTGSVSAGQLPALIGACAFFVFPSTCENCPNAVIEALSAGKAIAASDRASIPEMCGDAARYFDPDDPRSIADRLIELATDEAVRGRMETAARLRARQYPPWTDVARRTLEELVRAGGGRMSAAV